MCAGSVPQWQSSSSSADYRTIDEFTNETNSKMSNVFHSATHIYSSYIISSFFLYLPIHLTSYNPH